MDSKPGSSLIAMECSLFKTRKIVKIGYFSAQRLLVTKY